jgi:uncharacterized repeat protein (TIGR03803 family)
MPSPLKTCVLENGANAARFLRTAALRTTAVVTNACLTSVAVVSVLALAMAGPALAATENVIYSFANPPDAYGPKCNLVLDTAGNMYGTTFSGGAHNLGAVFVVTPTGAESVVYSFAGGADGSHPIAGLFRDKRTGDLYGTTVFGGTTNNGTVFVLNPTTGVETVLYSFQGGTDGANPYSSVLRLGTTIFGTTYNGGSFGYGTAFKITAAGKESVLHSFNSAFPTLDGSYPYAGLALYKGILYGTTTLGGASNLGTVFTITTSGGYTLLYSFKGGTTDGQTPNAGVAFDKSGNIYGTTYSGGFNNGGVVFTISGGVETAIHHFGRNTADGTNPYASLILYKGSFYGTTLQGGTANGGVVFKITPSGTKTVLHSFVGGSDGYNPYSALVLGASNAFYSTTLQGGTSNLGTVFRLIP